MAKRKRSKRGFSGMEAFFPSCPGTVSERKVCTGPAAKALFLKKADGGPGKGTVASRCATVGGKMKVIRTCSNVKWDPKYERTAKQKAAWAKARKLGAAARAKKAKAKK